MSVERISHTRRIWGSRIIEKEEKDIKSTTIESPWLGVLRQTGRVASKIGRDSVEFIRAVPWKNYMFQNICVGGIALAAYFHQRGEAMTQDASLSLPQPEPQPQVEAPVSQETAAIAQPFSYTIQKGDTLFNIARKTGISVETILNANPWIKNRNLIHAGDNLVIPGKGAAETIRGDKFRRIVGNPETSGITKEDIAFLQWLNAKQIWWEDWNGHQQIIIIPIDPYRYAKTVEEAGGPPLEVMLGLGATETGYYPGSLWEAHTESYAEAVGPMQVLKENFEYFAPYPGGYIYDPKYNFLTGGNLASYLGLDTSLTEKEWVDIFLGKGPTKRVWNYHEPQARRSYRIAKALEGQRAQFESEYQQKID